MTRCTIHTFIIRVEIPKGPFPKSGCATDRIRIASKGQRKKTLTNDDTAEANKIIGTSKLTA